MNPRSSWIPRASNTRGGEGGMPSGSASGRPTSGLSKPRLAKVRRRPTPRTEAPGMRAVEVKLGSWYPFDDSSWIPSGESARSGDGNGSEEGVKSFVFGSSRSFPESRGGMSGGETAGSGVSVFGRSAETRKTANLHRRFKDSRCGLGSEKAKGVVDSSSFSIGEGLGASLPDRMRRLDVGKTSQQQGGVRDDKLNVDGSNIKFSCGGDSNVFGQSMASKLPENMRKLNINSSTDEFRFSEATKDDAFKTNIAREHANHFGFNSEARNSNLKTPSNIFALKKLQRPDGIVFGSSKDATYSLDEDIESKLPVKIKRLNIANEQKKNQEDGKLDLEAGNLFSETSTRKTDVSAQNVPRDIPQSKSENIPDTILNTKVPASGTSIFVESDPFVFSSGKNRPDSDSRSEMHRHIKDILSSSGKDTTYSLDEDIANKLPVKMKRLNIENEQKKNQEDGKLDLKAGNLFSETSSRKTDISAQKVPCGIHRSTSESIPDTILNAKVPATGTSTFVKSDPFVFSSGKNKPDSDSRSEMHTHNIMDTLSSSGNNNWSVRGLDNSSITDNSTFPKFKFQTNEQDRSTGTGVGCSIDSDYHFVLNETGSSLLPSVDPGMPPVATDFTFTSVAKECKIPNKDASFFGKTDPFVFTSSKNVSSSDRRCEMHTFVEDTLPNSFNDSQSVREQDKSSTTDNSTFPDFKFQTNEQDRNAEIDIDCSINSDYHFVTNETDSFHPSSVDPGLPSVAADFTFTSVAKECKIPIKDASFFSQEHIFSEKHSNLIFNSKKGFLKDSRSIKRREKLEKFFQDYQNTPTDSVHRDKSPKDNLGAYSSGYSPMDFSPYEEVLVADTRSRPSVSLDDSVPHVSSLCSGGKQQSNSVDDMENLVSAAQYLVINETNVNSKEPDIDTEKDDAECFLDANTSFAEEEDDGEEVVSKPGQVDSGSAAEGVTMYYSSNNESAETKFSPLCSTTNESAFRFASEAPTQASFSSSKIFHRRKDHKKMVQKSHKSTLSTKFNIESTFPSSSLSNVPVQTSPTWTHGSEDLFKFEKNTEENKVEPNKKPEFKQEHVASTPESIAVQEVCEHCSSEDLFKFENNTQENMVEPKKKPEFKQEHAASTPESIAVREVCEKWRLRGNQAYENGHLSKAEEYYTRGVNCASSKKHSRGCTHELKLCYSNRAATRMSLGRLREALNDCMLAAAIDPNFLKAHVRAANCHLALGETEAASKLYKKCFEILSNDGSGSKILEEASNGLQTAQNVADCISRSAELLRKRACDDVNNALEIISEALLISPHSEYLIEMKAEALFSLKRYEEVIELCEKTMESSEINSSLFCADGTQKMEEVECKRFLPCKVWRWCLICRSYFYLGSLEEALSLVQKHQLMGSISNKCGNKSLEFFSSFSVTAKELLRLKSAGNDAFQAGRHLDAVEHYTAALMCSIESRPFAAICFCNRAAAYHGLGQVTDAIADCSLAIALDASYPKAISRRATLYELIRDYDQAASDLGRLISLMEKRTKQKSNKFGAVGGSTNDWDILKQARLRLASIEEEARKGISLNMYTILGIESSSSAADIKKAYRKAALKHHPDKASQLLVKGENGDDAVWKDVCKEVHMDADRLFKMIGEAYTVLSDPSKRRQYDAEEEKRAIRRKGNDMARRDSDDVHYSRFDRGSNNRYSEYSWSIHGNPHRKYSDYSYYSRY